MNLQHTVTEEILIAETQEVRTHKRRKNVGQALVEYALIVVLVAFALIAVLAATGPAIGNVFSNQVLNLLNQTMTPYSTLSNSEFWEYVTAVASFTPNYSDLRTNTPAGDLNRNDNDFDGVPNDRDDDDDGDGNPDAVDNDDDGDGLDDATVDEDDDNDGIPDVNDKDHPLFVPSATPQPSAVPPTTAPTLGAQPTVADVNYTLPFNDQGNSGSRWQFVMNDKDSDPLVSKSWDVSYYNTSESNYNSNFASLTPNATETLGYPVGVNKNWSTGNPISGINADGFGAMFVANGVVFEPNKQYTIQLVGNELAKVEIFNTSTNTVAFSSLSISAPNGNDTASQAVTFSVNNNNPHRVTVYYYDRNGEARIQLNFNRLTDSGECSWRLQSVSYHSNPSAWSDSETGSKQYAVNSVCHLRLRGSIDLAGATTPRLTFWERWFLATGDTLSVGVRLYNSGSAPWIWVPVRNTAGSNANWTRREMNLLTDFPGLDLSGSRQIELAFRVTSTDNNTADGWYLDDIQVENYVLQEYGIGFYDDAEDLTSDSFWINECSWSRTTENARPSPGNLRVWTDSPNGTQYSANSDCSLKLNGVVTLEDFTNLGATPQLRFWSKHSLAGVTDSIRVEYAPINTPNAWTALRRNGSPTDHIAQNSSNDWQELAFDLTPIQALTPKKAWLRLRLLSDAPGTEADGWYVDDIELREFTVSQLGVPFYEPFDSVGLWTLGGPWNQSAANIGRGGTGYALTDSPGGNYSTSPSNNTVQLIQPVNIDFVNNPTVEFYHWWDVDDANMYFEARRAGSTTWDVLWSKVGADPDEQVAWERVGINIKNYYTTAPQTFTASNFPKVLEFRFRFQITGGSASDGWFIDDFRIFDSNPPNYRMEFEPIFENVENALTENWHAGGTWTPVLQTAGTGDDQAQSRGPSRAWEDSPGEEYAKPAISALTYVPIIDLTGLGTNVKPTLTVWVQYDLGDSLDKLHIDVSENLNPVVDEVDETASPGIWRVLHTINPSRNLNRGWHRVQVNLDDSSGTGALKGKRFRIRFRLESNNTEDASAGWKIDEMRIFDREALPSFGTNYSDSFNDFGNWIAEGNWSVAQDVFAANAPLSSSMIPVNAAYSETVGSPSQTWSVTSPNWVTNAWHIPPTDSAVWGAGGAANPSAPSWSTVSSRTRQVWLDTSETSINFNWSNNLSSEPYPEGPAWTQPGIVNHEWYVMQFRRTVNVAQATSFRIRLRGHGGMQLLIYPQGSPSSPISASSTDRSSGAPTNPWDTPSYTNQRTYTYEYNNLGPGTYTMEVRYYHTVSTPSNPARLSLDFAERSSVARTQPSGVDEYNRRHQVSLVSRGYFELPANLVGQFEFDERWQLGSSSFLRAQFSTDGGTTWTTFASGTRTGSSNSDDFVRTRLQIPSTGTARRVLVRFQLDTLSVGDSTTARPGWQIDNFRFSAGDVAGNVAPSSTYATITAQTGMPALVSDSGNFILVVDDDFGDTFTYQIVSQPRRGFAEVVGNVIRYTSANGYTGSDSFTYRAIDSGGLMVEGTASVTVTGRFVTAYNFNGSGFTADGNTWVGVPSLGTAGVSGSGLGTWTDTDLPNPNPTNADIRSMLQRGFWVNDGNNNHLEISGLADGIYSVYIHSMEDNGTTWDNAQIWINGTNVGDTMHYNRVASDVDGPSANRVRRYGPYTVSVIGGAMRFRIVGGNFNYSGIELWRGDLTPFWGSDVRSMMGIDTRAPETQISTLSDPHLPVDGLGSSSATIKARGWDIWGDSDGMRYLYMTESGGVQFTARMHDFSLSSDPWAKAGIMVRSSSAPNACFVAIFATNNGSNTASQWRTDSNCADGGGWSPQSTLHNWWDTGDSEPYYRVVTIPPATPGGEWTVETYYSADGNSWTLGSSRNIALGSEYLIGVAVTSHNNGQNAYAAFDRIGVQQR